jgi:hypothetical protein
MQGVSVSLPTTQHSVRTVEKHDPTLEAYLAGIHWYDSEFPTKRIEMMLAASCLRFLEGLNTLEFVLGLSDAIVEKQEIEMSLPLTYAQEILQELAEKYHQGIIPHAEKTQIDDCINDALEVLINRRYSLSLEDANFCD